MKKIITAGRNWVVLSLFFALLIPAAKAQTADNTLKMLKQNVSFLTGQGTSGQGFDPMTLAQPPVIGSFISVPLDEQQKGQYGTGGCLCGVGCSTADPLCKQTPSCVPGVTCGNSSQNQNQTPPNPNGTPLPGNYQPRPTQPPVYSDGTDQATFSKDAHTDWYEYRTPFGEALEHTDGWQAQSVSAHLVRGGADVKQSDINCSGSECSASLQSQVSRDIYRLYYRYECPEAQINPDDSAQCVVGYWQKKFEWFYDRTESGGTSSVSVTIRFNNNLQPLYPWEKDVIGVGYDGVDKVSLDLSGTGYNYSPAEGPLETYPNGRKNKNFVLTAQTKILQKPEQDKVKAVLQQENGQVVLSIYDWRNFYYAGETLEICPVIKKDSGSMWHKNPVIYDCGKSGVLQAHIDKNQQQYKFPMPSQGSGKYLLDRWTFRRANSKISMSEEVRGLQYDSDSSVQVP